MLVWGSCGRNGKGDGDIERFERDFQIGKTFKYYFQCRRADIWGATASLLWESARNGQSGEAAYSLTSLI